MKVSIEIPASLADIKLRQYQMFLNIQEPNEMDLLMCVLDSDRNTLSNLKDSEFKRITAHINSLFDVEHKLINMPIVNGVKLGLIPDFDAITYGENKDITGYINDWGKMHQAIAVLYRPIKQRIGKKYLIEDYKGTRFTSEMMLEMPLDVVLGVIVFFWTLTSELLSYIPNYLQAEMEKNKTNSIESGEVITNLRHSLTEILGTMQKLQHYPYIVA